MFINYISTPAIDEKILRRELPNLFSLQALPGVFFVCSIDFFASISAQAQKVVKKTKNTSANAASENKSLRLVSLRAWDGTFFVSLIDLFARKI